mmetsp:Transcript_31509/g.78529  ORF Transcript_31509/g.78529 Transcript_31509/m.78529 type:complete len:113 (-) Transcript_31509:475-813(-)
MLASAALASGCNSPPCKCSLFASSLPVAALSAPSTTVLSSSAAVASKCPSPGALTAAVAPLVSNFSSPPGLADSGASLSAIELADSLAARWGGFFNAASTAARCEEKRSPSS